VNIPPIIENMLSGIETPAGRAAFLRATDFADPRTAERHAWQVDQLAYGTPSRQPIPEPVAAVFAFILDRHWALAFGNRKPPAWSVY
jgi:hypothetical protein